MKKFIKWYLKRMTKAQREARLMFVGKRLFVKQYAWLHFTRHPWEDNTPTVFVKEGK